MEHEKEMTQFIPEKPEARLDTRVRALETVAEVAQQVSTNLNLETLLPEISDLTKERFGLYHAHVYLLDQAGETLALAAGAGEAGKQMVERGHAIPLNRENSLVARAGRTHSGVIVNDVREDDGFMPNPLLPETRAEIAVPMIVGDTLVGVLDMQSDKPDAFTSEDVTVYTVLARQIAIAIQNARTFEQTQLRVRDLQLNSRLTEIIASNADLVTTMEQVMEAIIEALGGDNAVMSNYFPDEKLWRGFAGAGEGMTTDLATTFVDPIGTYPHGDEVVETGKVVAIDHTGKYEGFPEDYIEKIGIRSVVTLPVFGEDRVTGVIFINFNQHFHTFTPEEISLLTNAARQLSVSIQARHAEQERARLYTSSIDLLGSAGFDGYFKDLNPAWEATLGWSLEELMSKPYIEFVHADDVERTNKEAAEQSAAGHKTLSFENRYITKNGDYRWMSWNATPNVDTGLIYFVVRDVTEAHENQEKLEAAQEITERLFNTSEAVNTAANVEELMSAVAENIGIEYSNLSLTLYENLDRDGATYLDVVAAVVNDEGQPNTTGIRLNVADFPMAKRQQSRDMEIVTDTRDRSQIDEISAQNIEQFGNRAFMSLQLMVGDRVLGSLTFSDSKPRHFSMRDQRLAQGVRELLVSALERVRLQTQSERRAEELLTVATVGAEVSTTLDASELLWNVSELTKDRFDLYHAHIYLLDDEGKNLALAAGAGDAGQQMVERGHAIPLNREDSLVARAGRTRTGVIVNDVRDDEGFLPNPLLPDTRAEMAVPMVVGDMLVGVLDIQSDAIGRFSDDDTLIMTTLASQIAVAVQNARSFEQTEYALQRTATLSATSREMIAADTLDDLLQAFTSPISDPSMAGTIMYVESEDGQPKWLDVVAQRSTPEIQGLPLGTRLPREIYRTADGFADGSQNMLVLEDTQDDSLAEADREIFKSTGIGATVSIALRDRHGTWIGLAVMSWPEPRTFSEDELDLYRVLGPQLATILENRRLLEQAEKQTERERAIAEQLREVDRLKSQFLANMSHELRTPLNSIIGYSEVLLDGVDGELTEDAEEDVEAIHNSGKHLLAIINEILDLAKIEAGEMNLALEPINLADFASEIVRSGQVLVKDKPVTLELVQPEELPSVHADAVRLRQILWNLFSNAIKFTEEGSVKIILERTDNNMARVTVKDTGVGMTEDGLNVIFERFSQVDGSSTRRAGGTGLGLTITQQLVQLHGGEIDVESEVGVGSTFWFTLPLYQSEKV